MCFCSRLRPSSSQRQGQLLRISNGQESLLYCWNWCTRTLHLSSIFFGGPGFVESYSTWIFFDVIHIIQLSLRGRAPAILVTPVNVLSSRVRHRLVSRRSRRLRIRKFVLPTRYLVWCAEQALQCPTKAVGLMIIFPEDVGGSQDGPSSVWTLREFQLLEGIRDARRVAGYLC